VTAAAIHIGMPSAQGEIRVRIMVKTEFFPAPGGMALLAVRTITALVYIIELVTGITGLGRLHILFIHVATATGNLAMPTHQAKPGFIMIIPDAAPAIFVVATVTLFK
jgi:hypothetical protein